MVAGQTIAAEDKAAYDGLEQIVGKTHTTEDTEVMKHSTNTLKEHGEDTVHLAAEQPSQHVGHHLVTGQRMGYRLRGEDVEMLYGVIQDDACYSNFGR